MGLFDKLRSILTDGSVPSSSTPTVENIRQRTTTGITATITGPASPSVQVSDAEVAARVREYAFVLTTDPPTLTPANQWWNEDIQERLWRKGSEKVYAWLLPFVPIEIAKLEQLQTAQKIGPHGGSLLAKGLRALIRERRKAKEPYKDLLQSLYAACVIKDFSDSLFGVDPLSWTL